MSPKLDFFFGAKFISAYEALEIVSAVDDIAGVEHVLVSLADESEIRRVLLRTRDIPDDQLRELKLKLIGEVAQVMALDSGNMEMREVPKKGPGGKYVDGMKPMWEPPLPPQAKK